LVDWAKDLAMTFLDPPGWTKICPSIMPSTYPSISNDPVD